MKNLSNTTDLPDIADVEPFSEKDNACLEEIRQVLIKHGNVKRFGLTLLHRHFEMSADETLVEETDPLTRIQTIKPVKLSEVPEDVTVVNLRLDTRMAMPPVCRIVMLYC